MPLYHQCNNSLLFIHIPKCGGSSLEIALRKASKSVTLFGHGCFECSPQHFHVTPLKSLVPDIQNVPSFTVVREPTMRFISGHMYRNRLRQKKNLKPKSFTHDVRHCLFEYKSNPYVYDNHLRPQVEFIFENTEIFKLENGLAPALLHGLKILTQREPSDDTDITHEKKSKDTKLILRGYDLIKLRDFYYHDYRFFGYKPINIKKKETISLEEFKDELLSNHKTTVQNTYDFDVIVQYYSSQKNMLRMATSFSKRIANAATKAIAYPFIKK